METYHSNADIHMSAMAGRHWMFGPSVSVAAAVGVVGRVDLVQGMPSVEPAGTSGSATRSDRGARLWVVELALVGTPRPDSARREPP